jgi:hypothetical protein
VTGGDLKGDDIHLLPSPYASFELKLLLIIPF